MGDTVVLPPMVEGQAESWKALLEVAPSMGHDWILVGGQMVLLHCANRKHTGMRPTTDVDIVVDIRSPEQSLTRVNQLLIGAGFSQDQPGPEGLAHRYRRGSAVFDVLVPDHMGGRSDRRIGVGRTVEAPGTRQALGRAEVFQVETAGHAGLVRCPSLVGAVIGKVAAVLRIDSATPNTRQKHLDDVDVLATLLGADDRRLAALSQGERQMFERIVFEHGSTLSPLATRSIELTLEMR
ncbi:MAG: nucleotidyl transferase AbiEii/AbiGii toxin family protein [Acidimicrobiia bacterium]|nr:nucleotidyl transferase AbiEii/AbiGii toxin family protein [Acidimicrobiia bacterium]